MKRFVPVLLAAVLSVYTFPSLSLGGPVAAGSRHSVVVTPDGHVWTWGGNGNSQLGDGLYGDRRSPAQLSGISDATAVSAGALHTLVLKSDGTVWSFGYNGYGQLGDGTAYTRSQPVQVTSLSNVVAIAAGDYHSLALTSDGHVWAWGQNTYGQLGIGTTANSLQPVQISALSSVSAIGAGSLHSLAVKSDGTAWAWGINGNGQLGDSSTTQRTSPVQMSGISGAVAVSGGSSFTLVLKSDGTVRSTGNNANGQLGDGTTTQRTSAVTVTSLTGVASVSAGQSSGYALKTDGTVWAWGSNVSGRLGDGTTTTRTTATQAVGLSNIGLLAAGEQHAIAITTAGTVWTWGSDVFGQLGDGTTLDRLTPAPISEDAYAWKVETPAYSVAAGTYGIDKTVAVTCGTSGATIHYTLNGATPTESDPVLTSGTGIVITQSATLKARAWKSGMPTSDVASATYTLVVSGIGFSPVPTTYTTAKNVTLSTSSPGVTIRYTTDGSAPSESSPAYSSPITVDTTTTIRAAGYRSGWTPSGVSVGTYTMNFGTLAAPTISPGAGTFTSQADVSISAASGATIRYTTNGTTVTTSSTLYTGPFPVTATGTVNAKAFHPDYTASAQSSVSYTVVVATPVLSIPSGTYTGGQTVTVSSPTPGATLRYTLNNATPSASDPIVPASGVIVVGNYTLKVSAWKTGCVTSGVASASYQITGAVTTPRIGGGDAHSVAVRSDGVMWGWGANSSGQLGDGTLTQRTLPVVINGVNGVVAVSAGSAHTLAVQSDGVALAWGVNTFGQLGDGTTTTRTQPTPITSLSAMTSVSAGASHSLAVKSDGTVWAWGTNVNGVLGDGTTTQRTTPIQASGLSGITAVSAGGSHSLALKSDGTAWSWGNNGNGQLGTGNTTGRTSAGAVTGLTGVAGIAAGSAHSLAVLANGTVKAWGYNGNGQLGDGTTTQRLSPVSVPGLTNVAAVSAGLSHSLAVTAAGAVYAWGLNANGQVGDGTTTTRTSPVLVAGLPTVIAVSAGSYQSLALGSDGSVWAWGRNTNGQVGDGSTTNRLTPVQIAGASMSWSIPLPVLSLASGQYSSGQTVTITSSDSAATLHYTTDGSEPGEAAPVIASGGSLSINVSQTVKVRAWKPGAVSSELATGVYELKAQAPTVSPGGGSYTGVQSVTLTATTSGASTTYTLDGSDPTSGSTTYTAPIVVGSSRTLKARSFKSGWTPSDATAATYTIQGGAVLQLAAEETTLSVTHTASAVADWIHWGRTGTPDRKAGVPALISDATAVGGAVLAASADSFVNYGWTDSNQSPAAGTGVTSALSTSGIGHGFQLTVPADTTVRTLRLYVSASQAVGTLTASLSDGSATAISDASVDGRDRKDRTYFIDFRAASAGQTLTITFVETRDYGTENNAAPGSIALAGAELTPHLPGVFLDAPLSGATVTAGNNVALAASASQFDRSVTDVRFLVNGANGPNVVTAPYEAALTAPAPGHYTLKARATDSIGLSRDSRAAEIDVIGTGGAISGTLTTVETGQTPVADLTAEGTGDWVLWGRQNTTSIDRKFHVTPLISNYAVVGNHRSYQMLNGIAGFTYHDGDAAGTPSAVLTSGIRVFEVGSGYQITVPAGLTPRTLKLYIGADRARARLSAYLSDGSSGVIADTNFDHPEAGANGVYALTFHAASDGQTLTVRYTLDTDYGNGDIVLEAASLDGAPVPSDAPVISSISPKKAGIGMPVTISGSRFGAVQGASTVTINGVNAAVSSWSDYSIVVLVPDLPGSGPVVVTVNGEASNSKDFEFALGMRQNTQTSYISPDEIRLTIGQQRRLKLVDPEGHEIKGATWTVSDETVAVLVPAEEATDPPSTDPPAAPNLSAKAVGQVIITAVSAAGTARAQATVYADGSTGVGGTWEVYPDSTGGTFTAMVKGQRKVPNDPTLYLTEAVSTGGSSVRALASDGQQLWRVYVDDVSSPIALPNGGLLIKNGDRLMRLDGDGDVVWSQPAGTGANVSAVGYDGTIYDASPSVIKVWDGETGALRYTVSNPMPTGTFTVRSNPASPFSDATDCAPYNSSTPPPPVTLQSQMLPGFVGQNGRFMIAYRVLKAVFTSDSRCSIPVWGGSGMTADPLMGKYELETDIYVAEFSPTAPGTTTHVSHDVATLGSNYNGQTVGIARCYAWSSLELPCWILPAPAAMNDYTTPSTSLERFAPDGSGGALLTRSVQPNQGFGEDRLLRVLNGAVQYDVPTPGYAGGIASIAISDNGDALFSRGNVSVIDPQTGALRWETSGPNGMNLLSADADGGVVVFSVNWDSGVPVTTITVLDQSGAVSGEPAHLDGDLSAVDAQYMSAGQLALRDGFTGSVQMLTIDSVDVAPGSTYPVSGGAFAMVAVQSPKVEEFRLAGEAKGATGFDEAMNAVMVPLDGTNSVYVTVPANVTVSVTAAPNAKATPVQSSIVGNGQPQQLTINGVTEGTSEITFRIGDVVVGRPIQVDVKARRTFSLAYYRIIDPSIPTAPQQIALAELQSQFDRLFLRQANIKITVGQGADFTYPYDTSGDGKMLREISLEDPTLGCFGCRANSEALPLTEAFKTIHGWGSPTAFRIFYVNEITGDVGGFSVPKAWPLPAIVRANWQPSPVPGFVENISAHEVGHLLGRGADLTVAGVKVKTVNHSSRGKDFLMFENNNGRTVKIRLSRDDWNIMNFVESSPIPIKK